MSSSNVLKIASLTSTITFAATDAKCAEVLRWFVEDYAAPPPEGATQAQVNQYTLDQDNAKIKDFIIRDAKRARMRKLLADQVSAEQQAELDTQM